MRPEPKYVIDLAMRLEEARALINRLQAEWDALFTLPMPQTSSAPAHQPIDVQNSLPLGGVVGRNMRGDSAISRTLEVFKMYPEIPFNAIEISNRIATPVPSTRSNLAKLYELGQIVRTGNGYYKFVLRGSREANDQEVAEATS